MTAAALAALGMGVRDVSAQDVAALERPVALAGPIVEAPTIDGDVLADPAWAGVTPTSGFVQKTPDTGRPVSERTEVYIAFTDDTLYFGVVCYDREPDRIVVADSRRDSELVETDSFQIILDTYGDEQTGFVFGTNPVGIEYDGQVTREGEGSAFSAGGFNKNWDGVWVVSAEISDIGWSAEFAIPFTTLRYPRGEEQAWKLNMQRNIRRHNEQSFWSPIPVQFEIYRLALAGSVTGLRVPSQRNLKLLPYVLGEIQQEHREATTTDHNFEFGIDLKYSITPSLTLDATYNTDFAQVEADEFQINLDRFNIFFPEKRPFFLENAGYFSVGVPEEVELFFSRRIGIGSEGEVVPIIAGARMSGKLAQRYNLGALYMRTEAVTGVTRENGFAVARLSRDLPNRSYIGGIVISRRGYGSPDAEDDDNHTFSVDGRLGIGEYGLIQGFVLRTVVLFRQLHRGGRRLQPGGRVPDPARLPQAIRLRHAPYPSRGSLGVTGDPSARFVQRVLGLRRIPGNRCSSRRHPLGVALVLGAPYRHQLHPRGREGGVRDLPGHLRLSRNLRQRRGGARTDHQPGGARRLRNSQHHRRFLRRRSLVADAQPAIPHR
jgi:hypothetical protein